MFRRRRSDDRPDDPTEDQVDEALETGSAGSGAGSGEDAAPQAGADASNAAPSGPYDAEEVPEDGLARLDLGGLLVPVMPGMEARVDVDQQQQTVVAATLVDGDSALQINAFAAPRSSGIWAEVRDEIIASLRDNGGSAEVVEGPFGPEIRAQVPSQAPGQQLTLQPARFIGVDGPRWFVRGLLSGAGATHSSRAERLEDAFRKVVVVRGAEAMAPRDPLPLRLPKEAVEAAQQAAEEQAAQQQGQQGQGLNPFERGPEITEVY